MIYIYTYCSFHFPAWEIKSQDLADPRSRVENSVGLAEFGDAWTEFYSSVDGLPVARGYDRIVYGDHGPYVDA